MVYFLTAHLSNRRVVENPFHYYHSIAEDNIMWFQFVAHAIVTRIVTQSPCFTFFFPLLSSLQTASSSGDPHVHIIKEVKATDGGLYTCIAGNVLGQATASAYLEVSGAFKTSSSASQVLLIVSLALTWLASRWNEPQHHNHANRRRLRWPTAVAAAAT